MRKTIKLNNTILKQMKKIYYPKGSNYIDWMGFKITEDNKPSYHHIEKAENLRKINENDDATMENGAYLGKRSHELLHRIETKDYELYESWNYLFSLINKMKTYPIDDVWNLVNELKEKTLKLDNEEVKKL
ncbi:MAG: hypothetical protein J6O62_03120 [Bacilli bacterium]|nr:hypothetical protein [Bacilli bacterium]MBO6195716.1 hypothetical protein [Bacilli bacterium]